MFTEEFLAKAIEIACCTLSKATIHMKYICIIFFSQLYHENKSLDEAIKVLQTALSKHPDHANNQGKLFVFFVRNCNRFENLLPVPFPSIYNAL